VQDADNQNPFRGDFVNDAVPVSGVVPCNGDNKAAWPSGNWLAFAFAVGDILGFVEQKGNVAVGLFPAPNLGGVGVSVGEVEVSFGAVLN
jgi:hypothetical protein